MRRNQIIAIGVAAAALLTGCSGAGVSDTDASGVAVYSDGSGGGADAELAAQDAAQVQGEPGRAEVVVDSEYLVREASLGIKVDGIEDAAVQVREIAREAGGSVTSEQFGDGFYGPATTDITRYGTMTISVPSEALDATLTRLSELGEVRTRTSSTQDVQDEYVDVEARIATLEASIGRMRDLMEQTEDIEQIVELETALSARQADLDSLQARLSSLQSRIAMSPVTVMLTTTDDLGEPDDGIVAALRDAWNAFTRSAALLIATVGALLPWLLVGGVAAWLLVGLVRRLRSRSGRRASAAAQTDATGAAGASQTGATGAVGPEATSAPETTATSTRSAGSDPDAPTTP